MKALLILFLSTLAFTGCSVTGEPIELTKACAVENDGKNLQVTGILAPRSSMYCSNRGGRMECPFDVVESAGGEKKMGADIAVGSGANSMDEVPKNYKKEELKVRDNASNPVAVDSDRVKLTGKLSVSPDLKVCLMQVQKIEK